MSESGSSDYWGSWLSSAKQQALEIASKAQELAEHAGKAVHDQATTLATKAQELRENYDLEVATSILMSTVGGPVSPTAQPIDHSLPIDQIKLTKNDLAQLDMIYVTENLISMAFPRDKSALSSSRPAARLAPSAGAVGESEDLSDGNDINVVAAYLRRKHQGRFMVWNISEESYDYGKFCDQVLEYRFPGHPAPPLGLLFKICLSVESWLDADELNVAVVHCLTGKGRTATLLACILTWMGEFDSPLQALQYVAARRGTAVDLLTIPSQRRYIQYFSNLLDGVKPSAEPLVLRRVILNSIPAFGRFAADDAATLGCCPYIQLFKNGKLIATAAAYAENERPAQQQQQQHGDEAESDKNNDKAAPAKLQLRWVNASEGTTSFRVDCPVQGDILLRCRHASVSGARVSMFRAAFHTGYVSGGVLRLTKAQLDGSASDARYADEFFIDLIFAPLSASANTETHTQHTQHNAAILPEAAEADRYESSIHKDARFWESVAQRKAKAKKRRSRKFVASQQEQFSIADDGKALLDDRDAMTEISFLAHDSQLLQSEKQAQSYQQDMELIKQLAELEGCENETSSSAAVAAPVVALQSSAEPPLPAPLAADTAPVVTAPHTPKTAPSVKVELQALEDLERELGLSDLHLFSNEKARSSSNKSATPKPTPVKKTAQEDDDNLDELEKYLQSLSSH